MSEESIIAESYSNLKSAVLLGRTDIVRGILSTAAESKNLRSAHFVCEASQYDIFYITYVFIPLLFS